MFKLIQLKTAGHFIFSDFEINFCPNEEIESKQYTSLIIGSNGTGKSNLIKSICEIFNFVAGFNKKAKIDYSFEIKYFIEDHFHIIYYKLDNLLKIYRNSKDEISSLDITKEILPTSIISSSYIFNDIYDLKYSNIEYHYLGIRSTTNNVFIKNPTKDLFINFSNLLISNINKANNYKVINSLFDNLNFEKQITVNYKIGSNIKLLELLDFNEAKHPKESPIFDKNTKIFNDFFEKRRVRYKNETFNRTIKSESNQRFIIFDYLLKNNEILEFIKPLRRGDFIPFVFNWTKRSIFNSKNEDFKNHLNAFKILQDLEIVDFHNFEVTKKTNIDFNYVSSGEYHIMHTLINILSKLKQNSLVLLDEPEISLHPKWQIEYFTLLDNIIKGFKDSHFIVASHSHFLVSDLDKNKSSIIILEKTKDNIIATLREKDSNTFGWSSEQILYEVFNVPTVRSSYISNIVSESINILSKYKTTDKENKTLLANIMKLKEVKEKGSFRDFDPILPIINEIIKK
jgi:predicted ATPase